MTLHIRSITDSASSAIASLPNRELRATSPALLGGGQHPFVGLMDEPTLELYLRPLGPLVRPHRIALGFELPAGRFDGDLDQANHHRREQLPNRAWRARLVSVPSAGPCQASGPEIFEGHAVGLSRGHSMAVPWSDQLHTLGHVPRHAAHVHEEDFRLRLTLGHRYRDHERSDPRAAAEMFLPGDEVFTIGRATTRDGSRLGRVAATAWLGHDCAPPNAHPHAV